MSAQSAADIRAQIEAARQQQYDLERALKQQLAAERKDFVDELRAMIEERGYDSSEIGEMLSKRRGRRRSAGGSGGARFVDPNNPENSYSRGPLPAWFKEQMAAAGLDWSNKDDRETFKANYLSRVEG